VAFEVIEAAKVAPERKSGAKFAKQHLSNDNQVCKKTKREALELLTKTAVPIKPVFELALWESCSMN